MPPSATPPLPATPYRAAEPLGALLGTHRVSRVQQGIRLGVTAFCALVAADCFWLGLAGPPAREGIDPVAVAIFGTIGLVFGALAAWALRSYARARRARIDVFEMGLRITEEAGAPRDVRWNEITGVWSMLWEPWPEPAPRGGAREPRAEAAAQTTAQASGSVLRIDTRGGASLTLPKPLRDPYGFGAQVREHTLERLLGEARAALDAGEVVDCGACAMSPVGLRVQGNWIPWALLRGVQLSSRWIEVRPARGGRTLVPTEHVRDAEVLLALAGERARVRGVTT